MFEVYEYMLYLLIFRDTVMLEKVGFIMKLSGLQSWPCHSLIDNTGHLCLSVFTWQVKKMLHAS